MSECNVRRGFCLEHQCWTDEVRCRVSYLAAEVEALRARNETLIATIQRQDSTFERQMEEHEELEALRAQVARVRELRDRFRDHEKWASYRNVETLLTHALEGDA